MQRKGRQILRIMGQKVYMKMWFSEVNWLLIIFSNLPRARLESLWDKRLQGRNSGSLTPDPAPEALPNGQARSEEPLPQEYFSGGVRADSTIRLTSSAGATAQLFRMAPPLPAKQAHQLLGWWRSISNSIKRGQDTWPDRASCVLTSFHSVLQAISHPLLG